MSETNLATRTTSQWSMELGGVVDVGVPTTSISSVSLVKSNGELAFKAVESKALNGGGKNGFMKGLKFKGYCITWGGEDDDNEDWGDELLSLPESSTSWCFWAIFLIKLLYVKSFKSKLGTRCSFSAIKSGNLAVLALLVTTLCVSPDFLLREGFCCWWIIFGVSFSSSNNDGPIKNIEDYIKFKQFQN